MKHSVPKSCISEEVPVGRTYVVKAKRTGKKQECYKEEIREIYIRSKSSEEIVNIKSKATVLHFSGNAEEITVIGPKRFKEKAKVDLTLTKGQTNEK